MKKRFTTLALLSAALVCGASVAQDQSTPPDPFSQPEAAQQARIGVHRLMGANLMDAAAMLTGQKEFDGYATLNRVSALEQLSQMSRDFFLVPGSLEGSNAKTTIPAQLADYKDKERALVTATFGLRTAVNNRDPKAGKPALMSVLKACNSCHEAYMNEPLILGPKPPAQP